MIASVVIVFGIIAGSLPLAQASAPVLGDPFSTIRDTSLRPPDDFGIVGVGDGGVIQFPDGELTTDLMPFVIRVMTVLIGAIAVVVFAYAGVNYIIRGDNEEEVGKSIKMLLYGTIGVAIASLSYAIINNVLSIFT